MEMKVIKNDISPDTFTCNYAFGSNAGDDYGLVGWFDRSVVKITLYMGKSSIGCIKIQKSDDSSITIGATPSGRTVEWNFQEGELFKKVQIFTNTQTVSGLLVQTDRQPQLEAYIGDNTRSTHKPHDVILEDQHGPGRVVGIFGNAGLHVESLGFAIQRNPVRRMGGSSDKGSSASGQRGRK